MAIQSENPSKRQSIGEAKAVTTCTTRTSKKHAGRPGDFLDLFESCAAGLS